MPRPLSFVRLDIARLGVEIFDRSTMEARGEWVTSFYRALALNKPELNELAAELMAESAEFAQICREAAQKRWKGAKTNPMGTHADPEGTHRNPMPDQIRSEHSDQIKEEGKIPPKRKHAFEKSEFFPFEKFREALADWPESKCRTYHAKAVGYSEANGGRYLNWVQAVRNWDRDAAQKTNGHAFQAARSAPKPQALL